MFHSLLESLLQNQILTGGFGAMALGWLAYQAKSLPRAVVGFLGGVFCVRVTMDSSRAFFFDVDRALSARRIRLNKSFEFQNRELTTGFGRGFAKWDGMLVGYDKIRDETALGGGKTILTMTFYTSDVEAVRRLLLSAVPADVNQNCITVAVERGGGWIGTYKRKRQLDTVFVEGEVGRRIVERLAWFEANPTWFERRGIPRKIGFVLHGPPGTGKTSLIYAIASELDLDIHYVTSLATMAQKIESIGAKCLLVIEDIDTLSAGLSRATGERGKEESIAAPLHEILNTLDGMQTPDGLKFIVTTNHLDRLDPALLRPGRIDHIYEVGALGREEAKRMFRAFYDREGLRGYAPTTGARLQQMFATMTAEEAEEALDREAGRVARLAA
jgi:chaperone BCS1